MGLRGDLTTFLFSHTRLKFAVLLIIKTLVKRGGGGEGKARLWASSERGFGGRWGGGANQN